MKRFFFVAFILFSFALQSAAQVTFKFCDGISNPTLKANVERNISDLLSEINNACNDNRALSLSNIKITPRGSERLTNLWSNIHFKCILPTNVQTCIQEATGFEVRRIMVQMKPLDNKYKGTSTKELSISFNDEGTIKGVRFTLERQTCDFNFSQSSSSNEERIRWQILNFIDEFNSLHFEKDLKTIDDILSDDSLIIPDSIINKAILFSSNDTQLLTDSVRYFQYLKKSYISKLNLSFQRFKYVNTEISDIEIIRHSSRTNYYGARFKMKLSIGYYEDEVNFFMLWDFADEEKPHVQVYLFDSSVSLDRLTLDYFLLP